MVVLLISLAKQLKLHFKNLQDDEKVFYIFFKSHKKK